MSEPLSRVKVGTLCRPEGPPEPMVVVPADVEKEDVRILKVCFYSNSFNPGKNFKLVKCTVQTEIRVSVAGGACVVCLSLTLLQAAEWPFFSTAGCPVASPGLGAPRGKFSAYRARPPLKGSATHLSSRWGTDLTAFIRTPDGWLGL